MSNINVISIDPAKSATSEKHAQFIKRFARSCKMDSDSKSASKQLSHRFLNTFFGINPGVSPSMSARLLILRLLTGALLIYFSLFEGLGEFAFTPQWCQLILGTSIAAGFFSRLTCFLGLAIFATFSAIGFVYGNPNLYLTIPALMALVFTITGPGIFCFDQLIRLSFIKVGKKRAKRRADRLAEERMSYKAFSKAISC